MKIICDYTPYAEKEIRPEDENLVRQWVKYMNLYQQAENLNNDGLITEDLIDEMSTLLEEWDDLMINNGIVDWDDTSEYWTILEE
jgi:hypothetical protein